MLIPGQVTPDLQLPLLGGGQFDLASPVGVNGTVLMFYRGAHCPKCIAQIREATPLLDDFATLGVDVVAISADDAERADLVAEKAGTRELPIAHSFELARARDWGLWLSTAREGTQEPPLFSEPGLFLVMPGQRLYAAWVQTTPFARQRMDDILATVRFQQDKDYPPRGTYDGPVPM